MFPLATLLRESRLALGLAVGQGAVESELRRNALNTVGCVQVLDDEHLEARSAALTRRNDGPGQEEFPNLPSVSVHRCLFPATCTTYAVPALAELSLDLVGVADPVTVPPPDGSRVVNTNSVNAVQGQLSHSTERFTRLPTS